LDAQRLKKFRKFVGTILPTQIYENTWVYPYYALVWPAFFDAESDISIFLDVF